MRRIIYYGSIPKYEPEVIRFLTAISVPNDSTIYYPSTAYEITGSELWEALNTATESIKTAIGLTLKADNLSTKFKYIYPRVGGTSTAHRYNLVTGTADGTYNGGWTHDGSGALPNGSTGYFDTGFSYGSANFSQNDQSFGVLSKTNASGLYSDFGVLVSSNAHVNMYGRSGANAMSTRLADNTNSSTSTSDSLGLLSMSRTSSTQYKQYKNGSVLATITSNSTTFATSPLNIIEAAVSNGGSPIQYSIRKRTWFWGGLGVTDTQMTDINTALATFETTLNR